MEKYINLTSHDIDEVQSGQHYSPSKEYHIRTKTKAETLYTHNGIPVSRTKVILTSKLPPKTKGIVYIVSSLSLQAIPDSRTDFVAPRKVIRSKSTNEVIGCNGFRAKDN